MRCRRAQKSRDTQYTLFWVRAWLLVWFNYVQLTGLSLRTPGSARVRVSCVRRPVVATGLPALPSIAVCRVPSDRQKRHGQLFLRELSKILGRLRKAMKSPIRPASGPAGHRLRYTPGAGLRESNASYRPRSRSSRARSRVRSRPLCEDFCVTIAPSGASRDAIIRARLRQNSARRDG